MPAETSNAAPVPDAFTPQYLIADLKNSDSEPAIYRSLFILGTLDPASGTDELKGPLDPFNDDKVPKDADLKPAFGVLTVHEQKWRQVGIGLGNLLQSVCLAPGEVTQVAVTRWERKATGTSTEATEQSESVSSQTEQNRAVNEVQRSVAKEAQAGQSSAIASSSSVQAGASWLFGNVSAANTTSVALTAQFSAGSRDLAAESTNAINQRTAEKSQALRSRRQSVVREVTEREEESLTTRVLANYNRRHTLNILFFEVLQRYELETKLTGWDRCLFVPMLPLDFAVPGVITRHGAQLLRIFQDFDAKNMIALLEEGLEQDKPREQQNSVGLTPEEEKLQAKIAELRKDKQLVVDLQPAYNEMLAKAEAAGVSIPKELSGSLEKYKAICKRYPGTLDEHKPPKPEKLDRLIIQAENDLKAQRVQRKIPAGEQLNLYRLPLSQELWLRMSPYRIYRILQNYTIKDQPLSTLVDPQPVGVFGNYLALRWGFARSPEGDAARKKFEEGYIKPKESKGEASTTVGLPTSGVFAEAVLGQGLAAEQIDARFGKWRDKDNMIPILPPKIAELTSRDRHREMDLKAQDFASSLAELRAEKLSDASYIDKVLGQVSKGDMFRDMGGLAQAVTLADKLAALSAEGATKAGDRAVELQKKMLDTFEKVLDSEAGKAAVAEFMLPGSGAALLGAKSGGGKSAPEKAEAAAAKK